MIYWDNVIRFVVILLTWFIVTVCIPGICLRPLMGKMRFSERILFYQIIAVLYCSFVTYGLSFLHIYHFYTMIICYVILPLAVWGYHKRKWLWQKLQTAVRVIGDLYQKQYGWKLLLQKLWESWKEKMLQLKESVKRKGVAEVFGVLVLLTCIAAYFGYYKFTHYGYAAPDEEVHLYWIQSLVHNNIFPAGMYPHSMHSILALICSLLPMEEVRVVLNYSTVIVVINMMAIITLMKKMQRGIWTSLAAVAVFGMSGMFAAEAYSRFQYTVPMEFGMVGIPAMIIALLNLLRENKMRDRILFMLSIAYTISAHFYVAILAAVVCLAFGIIYFREFIKKKLLRHIFLWGIVSVVISCLPFGIGYVAGYPFEQSMDWALGVISGNGQQGELREEENSEIAGEVEYWLNEEGGVDVIYKQPQQEKKMEVLEYKLRRVLYGLREGVLGCVKNEASAAIILITAFGVLVYGFAGIFISRKEKNYYRFCAASALAYFLLQFMTCFVNIGLPEIVDANRIKVFLYIWYTVVVFIVFEMISSLVRPVIGKKLLVLLSLLGSVALLKETDNLERNKYIYCVNQEEAMYACLAIMERCETEHYTVVSTTNELSVVRYYGYHVEWLDFLIEQENASKGDIYTIPTEDVYFIIEKRMLNYGVADYEDNGWGTELLDRVTKAYAGMKIKEEYLSKDAEQRSMVYKEQRSVIMSKAFYWAIEYQKYYNLEFSNVYESENIVVYHLEQNPYALNNLLLSEGSE